MALMVLAPQAQAGQTRALKIFHIHSREKATIVFKRNGRYDPKGLKQLNTILRDWRKNEPTRMDPRLFDLIWEVYQKSGSHDYIHVIGGYRSAGTNAMLRSRSKGVAEKSQHILGKAMDFYIPDVSLRKLREIGIKFQVGGVGFYPTSGSPFVHMDVGGVRAWPRLPRRELARIFPDGRTLHRPAEGGTMPGYSAALADYKRRVGAKNIEVAGGGSDNTDTESRKGKSLLAALFSGGDENEEELVEASTQLAKAEPEPKAKRRQADEQPILTAAVEAEDPIKAPIPGIRPTYEDSQSKFQTALFSQKRNPAEEAMQAALTPKPEELAKEEAKEEFVNLAEVKIPVPQLLGARKRPGDGEAELLTAAADPVAAMDEAATLNFVPLPAMRPADLVAAAELKQDTTDEVPGDVKPEEIAALAAETGEAAPENSTDEDEVAGILDSLDNAEQSDKLAEMASLDLPKQTVTRAIVLPAKADAFAAEEPNVKKGNRLKNKVKASNTTALTKTAIAQWAIDNGRVEELSKPVKAPRFVSRVLREQPGSVETAGFTTQIDPARFGGEATFKVPAATD